MRGAASARPRARLHLTATSPAGSSTPSNADQFAYTWAPTPPNVTGVSPASGPSAGGTTVTVTGTGLSGAIGVGFGSKPGTHVSRASTTRCTVISPAGMGSVDVRVTTAAGISPISTTDHRGHRGDRTGPQGGQ